MKKIFACLLLSALLALSACSAGEAPSAETLPNIPPASESDKTAVSDFAEASQTSPGETIPDCEMLFTPSGDPAEAVRTAIESLREKQFTKYLEFISAETDSEEAERYRQSVDINDSADKALPGTDKTLGQVNLAAVTAEYLALYDHSAVPFPDGCIRETFYLWQDKDGGLWTVFDNGTPVGRTMEEWEGAISKSASKNNEFLTSPLEWTPEKEGEKYISAYWKASASEDPAETVRSAIENQAEKDFTLAVSFEKAEVDSEETERYIQRRKGSEPAQKWNITGEMFDGGRVTAVYAEYHINYDPSATSVTDGDCSQYFYLWQDKDSSLWYIFESSGNHMK